MDNPETLPDFGYIVEPVRWYGANRYKVVWLNAEFGDSTLCYCDEESKAKMICDAMNEQLRLATK